MTITTRDGLVAATAAGQPLQYMKSGARTTIAGAWFSMFDLAGQPGAGTLGGASVAAGVVQDDTVAGTTGVNSFGGGATGYITKVDYGNTVACRLAGFDMLWKGGAYPFNATQTLASQPSYSARIPNADYGGTQIWIECVTAFTGNLSVAVTYTNQAGTTAHTTGTFATGTALTLGRMIQLPLQAGDTGVQKIESVTGTVATVGTFNVLVLRPLFSCRIKATNEGGTLGPDQLGMPIVFDTSAIFIAIAADSTASGVPELRINISNG
jgi:hypothetical protein